jgi:hypothetical protein
MVERVEFELASDQVLIHMKLSARRLIDGRRPPRRLRRLDEGTCEIFFFPGLSDPAIGRSFCHALSRYESKQTVRRTPLER